VTATEQDASPAAELGLRVGAAAALSIADVLARLGSTADGLSGDEAARRLVAVGPNAVRSHRVQPLMILGRQLRSAVLILLAVTAFVSFFLGERTSTVVIGVILAASVGLGFVNEHRAEKAAQALHSRVTHRATTLRDGAPLAVDVTSLVPGDVVRLVLGEVVPADIRLLTETGLECDESVLTGESQPAAKAVSPAVALTSLILVTNLILHRPLIQSLLFSLAIAVGITPQLLPAVVSTSLATGSRQLAKSRCSSSGWCASKISATWTFSSPTRPGLLPKAG
jgi:magnesium-transporting ATPase (P-type)